MWKIYGNVNKNGSNLDWKSKISITKKLIVKSWKKSGKSFQKKYPNSKRLSLTMKS